MINYYSAFMPQSAKILFPLHQLLRKNTPWTWNETHSEAFEKIKCYLSQAPILMAYHRDFPLILITDASSHGIGAILAHRMKQDNGKFKDFPIAYASRHLASAEVNYSQIEKEGLAIIFGLRKFHHYLFGSEFTLGTD